MSLVVLQVRLCASTAGATTSVPGWETRSCKVQQKKQNNGEHILWLISLFYR